MKLLIVLSVIACSYSAKLDRTYLPPNTAATAGGSPGSLTAPSGPGGFGPASGRGPTSGFQPLGPSGSNGPSAFGKPEKPSGPSGFGQSIQSDFVQSNQAGQSSGPNNFGQAAGGFGQQSAGFNQGGSFNQGAQPQNAFAGQGFPAQERAQAAADRNAEILKFENQNDGETFAYSFETSNGIAAEESGVATNGVQAQGGYSYTGDDGQFYQVTYTADENGYLPQGDHLPTPPPIPEEILLSLEKNAAAAAAGIQEGAYNPDEDNDDSAQQYNAGAGRGPVAYDQLQGGQQGQQGSGFNQQGGAFNKQRPSQQGAFNQQGPNTDYPGTEAKGPSGQFNQGSGGAFNQQRPSQQGAFNQQGPNTDYPGTEAKGPSGQFNQGSGGAFNQQRPSQKGAFNQQGPNTDYPGTEAKSSSGQFNQGSQGFSGNRAPSSGNNNQDNGYEYKRPQPNAQVGGQAQGQFNRPSQGSAFPRPSGPAGPAQGAFGAQTYNKPGPQRPTGPAGSSQGSFGSQSYNQPGTQSRPQSYNQGSQSSGSAFPRPSGQARPSQGSFPRPSSPSQGSFGTQFDQAAQTGSQGPSGSFPRPSGASAFNKGQQPSGTQGLVQAPYQYNRPGSQQGQSRPQGSQGPQTFGSQGTQGPQTFGSQGSQRPQGFRATQGTKGTPGRGQTFKGPQQAASFDEQDGYKY